MLHDVFSKENGSATVPMCCLWPGVHGALFPDSDQESLTPDAAFA